MSSFVAIVGAGLTGLMAAICLAQRGLHVKIFESRSLVDIESIKDHTAGKSTRLMSIDLSARAIYALKNVDVFESLIPYAVPMTHRILHYQDKPQVLIPYGQHGNDKILAVARARIFDGLLAKCREYSHVEIYFSHQLIDINFANHEMLVLNKENLAKTIHTPKIILGADGVNSRVRTIIESTQPQSFVVSSFHMSYKELSMLPFSSMNESHMHATHMWPREGMMLLAQPNEDHSLTGGFLMAQSGGKFSFDSIATSTQIRSVFDENFADASIKMPMLEEDYFKNPVSQLKIISARRFSIANFAMVIGDAAHGMVPFFGQGVNCCFEDCSFLSEQIDHFGHDWHKIFEQFDLVRVYETEAICSMSYENYPELFPNNNLHDVRLRREIDAWLSATYSENYRSYHNLVCFERVPYTLARRVKIIQERLICDISHDIKRVEEIDEVSAKCAIEEYRKNYAHLFKL